jgi:hypothetical protein
MNIKAKSTILKKCSLDRAKSNQGIQILGKITVANKKVESQIFARIFGLIEAQSRASEKTYVSMWLNERMIATKSKQKSRSQNRGS